VRLGRTKWLIVNCYKNPSIKDSDFENLMTPFLDSITAEYDRYVLMGDLNIDMKDSSKAGNSLTSVCDLFDLHNVIDKPTCFKNPEGTLIDVILTSNPRILSTHGVVETGLSDWHRLIYMVTRMHAPKTMPKHVFYRSYKTFNEEHYLSDLQSVPFHVADIFTDVDDRFGFCETLYTDICNEHAPLKSKRVRPEKPAAMNKAWHKAVMNKARLCHIKDKYPTKSNWENYRRQRNLCAKLKRKSIRHYFNERCGDGCDPKDFYKIVRPFYSNKGMKSSCHIQLLENDEIISNPSSVANVMNKNFVAVADSIGRPVDRQLLQLDDECFVNTSVERHKDHPSINLIQNHPEHHCDFEFRQVSPMKVETILGKLNTKKATGYDKIPAKLVKTAAPVISAPLSGIINDSFKQSKFPSQAKVAEVGPIYKKDSELDKNNYRPVSVLTCLSKVVETCINNQLKEFCKTVLSALISAYRKGYSCQYSLIKLCEEMRRALDDGKFAALLLMDLSKAFDCLPHDLMAAKLIAYGMSPEAVQLLMSYLRGRKQRVRLGEHTSEWMTLLKGVPQGSILGPCLFNLFINDLMFALKFTSPINYADDNTLCAISNSLQETIHKLVADGNISIDWYNNNDMKANPNKFQFLVTGGCSITLSIRGATIEQENYVKLLGVNIDKKLDFRFHVSEVCRKAGRQLNALRRQSRLLNMKAKKKVFNSFIRANLNYCPLVWVNRNKTDLARLEKVQERALRLVYNDKTVSYDDLLRRAEVPSVLVRWKRVLVAEVFKALNGISPPYIQDLFREKEVPYNLRASKIVIQPLCKTITHGINSLTYQGAKLWNGLSEQVKGASNIIEFQRLIEKSTL